MIRIAILQANSSHPEAFINIINGPESPFAGRARVETIWDEDPALSEANAALGVSVVPDLDQALRSVDLAMVCGRWGDQHPDMAIELANRKIPTFIDKPIASSYARACDVASAFTSAGVPAFSASAYRFAPELLAFTKSLDRLGSFVSGHAAGLSEWPDLGPKGRQLYFYAVHTAEMIQTVFGAGIETVKVHPGPSSDIAILKYADGRQVDWHLLRDCGEIYEVSFYGRAGRDRVRINPDGAYYENMLDAAVTMSETNVSPVPLGHSVEIVSLLDAVTVARQHPDRSFPLAIG